MIGPPVRVRSYGDVTLLLTVFTVTVAAPAAAVIGTVKVTLVSLHVEGLTVVVPLPEVNTTDPMVVPNPVPVIVTELPRLGLVADTVLISGGLAIVSVCDGACLPSARVTRRVAEPAATPVGSVNVTLDGDHVTPEIRWVLPDTVLQVMLLLSVSITVPGVLPRYCP
jgi:hypothetical protein